MVQVTLQFTTIYAAAAALMTLQEAGHGAAIPADDKLAPQAATGNGVPPAPSPAPTPTPAPTAAPVAAAPQAEPSASPVSSTPPAASPAETPKGEAAALNYEKDVKPVVIKVGAAGKRDALVELLKKYGVAKGPEVPADKLPAFKQELEALVA